MCSAHGGQKRVSNPLETDLQAVESCLIGCWEPSLGRVLLSAGPLSSTALPVASLLSHLLEFGEAGKGFSSPLLQRPRSLGYLPDTVASIRWLCFQSPTDSHVIN